MSSPFAFAQSTTPFASFTQDGGGSPFIFTNAGVNSNFSLVTASIPVNFFFQKANGYGTAPGDPIAATLTFSALVDGPVSAANANTLTPYSEAFRNVSLVFTANTPVNGASNLLTLSSASTGFLQGRLGLNTASLSETASSANPSAVVGFSSDFVDFTGSNVRSYNVGFDTIFTPSTNSQGTSLNGNGYLNTFTASASGNFSSNVVGAIPEPSSLLLIAPVLGGIALNIRKRRRKVAAK